MTSSTGEDLMASSSIAFFTPTDQPASLTDTCTLHRKFSPYPDNSQTNPQAHCPACQKSASALLSASLLQLAEQAVSFSSTISAESNCFPLAYDQMEQLFSPRVFFFLVISPHHLTQFVTCVHIASLEHSLLSLPLHTPARVLFSILECSLWKQ